MHVSVNVSAIAFLLPLKSKKRILFKKIFFILCVCKFILNVCICLGFTFNPHYIPSSYQTSCSSNIYPSIQRFLFPQNRCEKCTITA